MRLHCIVLVGIAALGCRDRGAVPARHLENGAGAGSAVPSVDALQQARLEHVRRLGASCKPEDWPDLILMATDRYRWSDDLATRHRRAAEDVQCRARATLTNVGHILFGGAESVAEGRWITRRRVAAALSRADALAALVDAISGRIRLPAGCPNPDAFAEIVEFAPIHELRPAIEAHASDNVRDRLLSTLDRDRNYEAGPREAQLERWAGGLTPDGFVHVLEALGPGYAWKDGAPPPTPAEKKQIEQHALGLIKWLVGLVYFDEPERACKSQLADAVARGRLGVLVVARLDHSNPEIRIALLQVLARVPAPGSRVRVGELEASDPDLRVRGLAAETRQWIDRGGMTNHAVKRRKEQLEADDARMGGDSKVGAH